MRTTGRLPEWHINEINVVPLLFYGSPVLYVKAVPFPYGVRFMVRPYKRTRKPPWFPTGPKLCFRAFPRPVVASLLTLL